MEKHGESGLRDIEALADLIAATPIAGGVVGIVARDGTRHVAVRGFAQVEPERVAMTRETWFDLASLTKVIFTTTTILRLIEQGRIASLDAPLTGAIPDLRQYDLAAAERRLTYRQCLAHQTHLPAVEPLYTYGQDPATLRAFVLQREWRPGPPVYSDINFILLGIAIERITGLPLRDQPLPHGLSFRPDAALCAATERCTWRGRVMRGEVHDENAFALGGASGHAGLFGTADGVLDFALSLLDGTGLSAPSLAEIRRVVAGTRTVGWEARNPGWHGGEACSTATIGHTGFTGTALYLDFERGLAWTLLTNRVHPTRHRDTGILALRQQVGTAVAQATVEPLAETDRSQSSVAPPAGPALGAKALADQAAREAREAAALRENLRKRKEQSRARATKPAETKPPQD